MPRVTTQESMKPTKRTFKVMAPGFNNNEFFGRQKGATPKQAAKKAMSSLKEYKKSGPIHFSLTESTRGSKRKTHYYVGERVKLTTPTIVVRKTVVDGVVKTRSVPYHFSNVVYVDKEATEKAKAAAKKAAKEEAAHKSTLRKEVAAKKAAAKKAASAKKAAAKKSVAKKSPAKKSVAKKVVAKKSPAKKVVAKKSTSSKASSKKSSTK